MALVGRQFCRSATGAVIPVFEDDNSDQADLRGGASPWSNRTPPIRRMPLRDNLACDALIVGCGITGALMAERLTRQGLDVILIDRELPGRGSADAFASFSNCEWIELGPDLSPEQCVETAAQCDLYVGGHNGVTQLCYSVGIPVFLLSGSLRSDEVRNWHADRKTGMPTE